MLHVTYNNRDCIVAWADGSRIELVDAETCELHRLAGDPGLAQHLLESAVLHETRIDPRFPAYPDRGDNFVKELQQRRLALLEANVKERRKLHKGPAVPGVKKPRGSRAKKSEDMLLQLIALSKGGST